jgi:hypothetical protein
MSYVAVYIDTHIGLFSVSLVPRGRSLGGSECTIVGSGQVGTGQASDQFRLGSFAPGTLRLSDFPSLEGSEAPPFLVLPTSSVTVQAAVSDSVLMAGSEAWTLPKR